MYFSATKMKFAFLLMTFIILASSLTQNAESSLNEFHDKNIQNHLKTTSINTPQQHQLFNGSQNSQHQTNYQHLAQCPYNQAFQKKDIDNALEHCQVKNFTDTNKCIYDYMNKTLKQSWNYFSRQKNGLLDYATVSFRCNHEVENFGKYQRYFYFWNMKSYSSPPNCNSTQLNEIKKIVKICNKTHHNAQAKCIQNKIKLKYSQTWNVVITYYSWEDNKLKQQSDVNFYTTHKSNCKLSVKGVQKGIQKIYQIWYKQ